jgi:hypothetical protein
MVFVNNGFSIKILYCCKMNYSVLSTLEFTTRRNLWFESMVPPCILPGSRCSDKMHYSELKSGEKQPERVKK